MKKNNPELRDGMKANARALRQHQTYAEKVLWEHLRKCKLDGFKFRRQHPVGRFILDFYCEKAKLAIEVDGGIHNKKNHRIKDRIRTVMLKDDGITVIRIQNEEVIYNLEGTLDYIKTTLHTLFLRQWVARQKRGD